MRCWAPRPCRPSVPTLACTTREETRRRLALVWGAQSALIAETSDMEQLVQSALQVARVACHVETGDRVMLTAGVPTGIGGRTNMLQVRKIP